MKSEAIPASSQSHCLEGKVAIVTGGGRGIGRAIAQMLAAAGAKVAVVARSVDAIDETARLIRVAGGNAASFPADVADPLTVANAMSSIAQSLGSVDVLINNAGVVEPFGPFWQTDLDKWWRGMEVNLRGVLLCSHAVLPGMVARGGGRIINVASGGGTISTPYYTSYATSKTALIRFTECLALETKPHGVTVFSISPGTVRTSMSEYSQKSREGQEWLPWFRRIFDEKIDVPAERPAQLVLDLASGRLDALSGRFLSIYDDLDMLLKNAIAIEERNLYSLKLEKLPSAGGSAALGSILADARRAAENRNKK
jgi:NAD(P)-dependent dehydrogenase (short-subunit alcohol dehydrogenase family)